MDLIKYVWVACSRARAKQEAWWLQVQVSLLVKDDESCAATTDCVVVIWLSNPAESVVVPIRRVGTALPAADVTAIDGEHVKSRLMQGATYYNLPPEVTLSLKYSIQACLTTRPVAQRAQVERTAAALPELPSHPENGTGPTKETDPSEFQEVLCSHRIMQDNLGDHAPEPCPAPAFSAGQEGTEEAAAITEKSVAASPNLAGKQDGYTNAGMPLPPTGFTQAKHSLHNVLDIELKNLESSYTPLKLETQGRVAVVRGTIRVKSAEATISQTSDCVPAAHTRWAQTNWTPGLCPVRSMPVCSTIASSRAKSQHCFQVEGRWYDSNRSHW
jgi:hypothetical protein